jgi:hypothetical protein
VVDDQVELGSTDNACYRHLEEESLWLMSLGKIAQKVDSDLIFQG